MTMTSRGNPMRLADIVPTSAVADWIERHSARSWFGTFVDLGGGNVLIVAHHPSPEAVKLALDRFAQHESAGKVYIALDVVDGVIVMTAAGGSYRPDGRRADSVAPPGTAVVSIRVRVVGWPAATLP